MPYTHDTSWVNLFSNESFVSNLDNSTLTNIMLGQKFPRAIFFNFIHETTHHWCFTSYVGNALFMANTRAWLRVRELNNTQEDETIDEATKLANKLAGGTPEAEAARWDIYTDHTRYVSLQKILQPLIEGLALFAEYDSYPTATESIPKHLVYTSLVFSQQNVFDLAGNIIDVSGIEKEYIRFLVDIRREQGIDRKSELLVDTMDTNRSPYLTGYLFVKSIQLILIKKHQKFGDPNLFIQFIRSWYFNDLGLVHLLLDDAVKDEYVAPKLGEYFSKRTAMLNDLDPTAIEEYENNTGDAQKLTDISLMTAPYIAAEAQDRLLKDIAHIFQNTDMEIFPVHFMREYFRVAQLKAYLTITANRVKIEFRVPDNIPVSDIMTQLLNNKAATRRPGYIDVLAASFPNNECHPLFQGEVFFEKYISFQNLDRDFTVFITNSNVPYYWFRGRWEKNEQETILYYFRNRSQMANTARMNEEIKACLEKNVAFATYDEYYNMGLFPRIFDFYQSHALQCTDYQKALIQMQKDGFWEIVGRKIELLDRLSELSIFASNSYIPYTNLGYSKDDPLLIELYQTLYNNGFRIFDMKEDKLCTGSV